MEMQLCVLFGLKWTILLLVGKACYFNIFNVYLMYVFSFLLDVKAAWLGIEHLNLPGCIRLTSSIAGWVQWVEGHVLLWDCFHGLHPASTAFSCGIFFSPAVDC